MLANILDQVIKTYGKEFLGDWDPINNFRIDSLTDPEIHLTNIPFPQKLFELAEIPFAVDYSNIAKVRAKFSWQTFFGPPGAYPFAIEADDLEIRIRLLYPSEWNSEFWRDKILKSKLKRTVLWEKFASLLGSAQGDRSSMAHTIEPRIVNSLSIRVRNIHVHVVDDNLGTTPWAFELHVDEFCIDSPKRGDPRISDMEATGLEQCMLMGLWMRFVGMHFWYRELPRPQLEGKAGVSVNINKARELRRRLLRNPTDEEAQLLLSKLLQRDAAPAATDASTEASAGGATALAAAAAAPPPEPSEQPAQESQLHPDLQPLERPGSTPAADVDAGTLTNMLSREIQETLHIEDQKVSFSLASKVLKWAWWCGKEQSSGGSPAADGLLTPLGANAVFTREAAEADLSAHEKEELKPSLASAAFVPEDPAVAAFKAEESAEAAAEAAAAAKETAAQTLRETEEDNESSIISNTSSEEENLLAGVQAFRAFKVVPSQIKDLLDDNTHAFRITPKKGIEMHILFKKWELRALGSGLAVNKQSWKTVELSFLHHDPTLYSPLPGSSTSSEQQQEQTNKRQEPPPAVFDGSMTHKPLQLTFTSAAVAALFNFVKLIDTWFIFMKGAARPNRLVAREEECTTYVEMWKRRLTSKAELREVVDRYIADFEQSNPLYLILKLRQMAEDTLTWRDGVSAAVLQKQIFGRFTEACCRAESFGSLEWPTGEAAETRTDCLTGGTGDLTDKERLMLDDIACTVDEASGDERGGFGGKRWFYIDGLLSVIVPNLCFRLLPLIGPGMHVNPPDHLVQQETKAQPRRSLHRHGTMALLDRLQTQHSLEHKTPASQPSRLPLTTLMFRVCTDFKFRQEKRNDFFKCHDIFIDSLFVEKGFAALKAKPCEEAISFRAPHKSDLQTKLPDLIVCAGYLGQMGCSTCIYLPADPPSRIGWGIGPARPPLRGHVEAPGGMSRTAGDFSDYEMIRKDELFKSAPDSEAGFDRWQTSSGPVVHIESPRGTDDSRILESLQSQHSLPLRIRPSRVYTNLHAFFDRARNLARMVKKTTKRASNEGAALPRRRGSIGGDKNRTIFISITSKLMWDAELGSPLEKKSTWISIPDISISAPELIPLADALPMSFVTWSLFKEKDCLLPASTEDAMGVALGYCRHVDSTLRLSAQKATVIYRLSSLDYSRVLSHLRRDAIAEARELQLQAEAAAEAAAQAAVASPGRFGGISWEGKTALSDGETPSSASGTSSSARRARWRQRGWVERAAAAAAAGRPLAFLGERVLEGRREFEANKRMLSNYSSSGRSLPDNYSDAISFSDSFLSSIESEAGMQAAAAPSAPLQQRPSHLDGLPEVIEGSGDDSEEEIFAADTMRRRMRSVASWDGLLSDMDYEPVEENGFASTCKGLKASVTTLKLTTNVKKRKSLVTSHVLSLSLEAAEAAVLAQPPVASGTPNAMTDCTVLSLSDINVARNKVPHNKVTVVVGRADLGVSKQLVSLAACKHFIMPTSFPYSNVLRDPQSLMLKVAQATSLQRQTPTAKTAKSGSTEQQQQHSARATGEKTGSTLPTSSHGNLDRGSSASPETSGDTGDNLEGASSMPAALRESSEGDLSAPLGVKTPEAFLPVPTTGPWAVCDGSRLDWFFADLETVGKFPGCTSSLKFTESVKEKGKPFQRWRLDRHPGEAEKEVTPASPHAEAAGAGASAIVGATEATTAIVPNEAAKQTLQVSAKVGCLSVGLYTQQQHLAVLLRVYEARIQLRKEKKDIRLKTRVGELFVEHLKVSGTQRRSIALCKRVVHIGAQCRRFPPQPGTAAPPTPSSVEAHPAGLVHSEEPLWSSNSCLISSDGPSHGRRRELSNVSQMPIPDANKDRKYLAGLIFPRRGHGKEGSNQLQRSDRTKGMRGTSSLEGDSSSADQGVQVTPSQYHLPQHQKQYLPQEEQQPTRSSRRPETEGPFRVPAFSSEAQYHGAKPVEIQDGSSTPPQYDSQQERAVGCDGSVESDEISKSEAPLSSETEKKKHKNSCTSTHSSHGATLKQTEEPFKTHEKHRHLDLLRYHRSRISGTSQRQQQHHHRGWPRHFKIGSAEDGPAEEALISSQKGSDSESNLDEENRPALELPQPEGSGTWVSDVVGGWTLRDETDRDDSVVETPQPLIGHDCCFGVPDAPLNLLLFDDNDNNRRMDSSRKHRKDTLRGSLPAAAKGGGGERTDQVSLLLHLQPESKTTEAQLCLQSLHAFPTANLLCCITDAALCLKSLWDEESIRSRCLLACLLGDTRSQEAARLAGLNLQTPVETEAKRTTKRHFTLNRRVHHQHFAKKYSSRGSADSSETSSYSSNSLRPGLSMGVNRLHKQERTTFSRWGPPEGLSSGEAGFQTIGSGVGRHARSLSGGRRRTGGVECLTREKARSADGSPTCEQTEGASHTIRTTAKASKHPDSTPDECPTEIRRAHTSHIPRTYSPSDPLQQQRRHAASGPDSTARKTTGTGGQGTSSARSLSVSIELQLKDVTCSLLTDDAVGTQTAIEVELTKEGSIDSSAAASPGIVRGNNPVGLAAQPTYVASQQSPEKHFELHGRKWQRYQKVNSNRSSSGDGSSTVSTASTSNGTGGDAGVAFPPFPVLFSPDLCVPKSAAAMSGTSWGTRLDSPLRRAVVADVAALGVRLEAALRITYASTPTGTSKKREEFKDTLRVGLWRLEATLLRNCTWALACVVLFDLNLRAECLRLLPPKKKRVPAAVSRGGEKSFVFSRTHMDLEEQDKRFPQLHAVAEGNSEEESDIPGAVQRALWNVDGEGKPSPPVRASRGSQRWSSLKRWEHGAGGSICQEGYASGEGSVLPGAYVKKARNSYGGSYGGIGGAEVRQGLSRQIVSGTDGDTSRKRPSSLTPRRLPSSGSSSFLRWVFGKGNTNNTGPTISSVAESSPQYYPNVLQAQDWTRREAGIGRNDRRGVETKQYTDEEADVGAGLSGAPVYVHNVPEIAAAPSGSVRRNSSTIGWPRSLLKSRRTMSAMNTDCERGPALPVKSRGSMVDYFFRGETITASGDFMSPSVLGGHARRRSQTRPIGNLAARLSTNRGMRALISMAGITEPARTRATYNGQQHERQKRVAEAKGQEATSFRAASSSAFAARRERRVANTAFLRGKEWEEERELFTCTAIDLEIKRIGMWNAVYLQDNKAAANPCRASAAAGAITERWKQGLVENPVQCSSATAAAEPLAETITRETEGLTTDDSRRHSRRHRMAFHSPRMAVGSRMLSPPVLKLPVAQAFGGTSASSLKPAASSVAAAAAQETRSNSHIRRAGQETQHLTCLMGEVWAEDWLSVSLPSPPPFAKHFRAQEGQVLLLPVLLRASTKSDRALLERRLQEAQRLVASAACQRKRGHSKRGEEGAAAAMGPMAGRMHARHAAATKAAAAAAAGFPVNPPEQKKKSTAAAERLRGAANLSPHVSVMYRLVEEASAVHGSHLQRFSQLESGGVAPETKIICRADVLPTFCACTPFLVDAYTHLFGKDGEMTAVLSRLSMGLRAIRLGMEQQQQTATEAAKAAVHCLPALAKTAGFATAAPSSFPNAGAESAAAAQQQKQESRVFGTAAAPEEGTPTSSFGEVGGDTTRNSETPEQAALLVDHRLWGTLPGSLLQFGFALRVALERLTHDAFVSLCIHSLQVTLFSPCQLLSLPAVPATSRLLPITAVCPTLTSEAFYFVCCLAAAPLSPCVAIDLVFTMKGLRKNSHLLAHHTQQHQQGWSAHNAGPMMGGPMPVNSHQRLRPSQTELRGTHQNNLSMFQLQYSPASPSVAAAPSSTAAAMEGLAAPGVPAEATLGSVKVAAPLLRVELLSRPRIPDEASPSAQEVAHDASPRILIPSVGTPNSDVPSVTGSTAPAQHSGLQVNQQHAIQSDCVLEVLLKDLEVTFVSETRSSGITLQQQRLRYALGGRPCFGSGTHLGRPNAEAEVSSGTPAGLDESADARVEPFRIVASLRDCIIRGQDRSRLLQNASSVPKLFSGSFSASGQQSLVGVSTSHGPYSGAVGPNQAAAGSATPTGVQLNNQAGPATARRQQQKARVCVQQALLSDVPLQDPLLQSLVWVSDGMIFVSGEVAYLRIHLPALQFAAVYSWGASLYGALQQVKHFRLQFPAISFGCCFSTASWLSRVGIDAQQLWRVSQLQSQGFSPAEMHQSHQQSMEKADVNAIRRTLLLQKRGLGLLCLLYPSLPPPAVAPEDWHGYLPLQLPDTATPISIHRVLQAIETEATAREAAAASHTATEVVIGSPPWRLQTAHLFQLHSDLRSNLQNSPRQASSGHARRLSLVGSPCQRVESVDKSFTRQPLGKPMPQRELEHTMKMANFPTTLQQYHPSGSDAASLSSHDGGQNIEGTKDTESNEQRVKKPRQGFWTRIRSCFCCRRRRMLSGVLLEDSILEGNTGITKNRSTGLLRSFGSSLSVASSGSATQVERKFSPSHLDSSSATMVPNDRGDRKHFNGISMYPSDTEGPDGEWQRSDPEAPVGPSKPVAPPSLRETAALGAKMQKVIEMTMKGIEIWFVVGTADGGDAALLSAKAEPTGALTAAGITSLKGKRKARLPSLAAMATPKTPDTEKSLDQRIEGQPLSRSVMQVILTATNRKGLCVEEESPDDRRKQKIVVGLLAVCTIRLLQRGPDVKFCGEIVELSMMVGSPVPCNDFVVSKKPQALRWALHQHPPQLPHANTQQPQQHHVAAASSRNVKDHSDPSFAQPSEATSVDQQQQIQHEEVVLCNFPDILEGYGGALLLPNLQQRSDCLLSVAPSTATVSGTPGGKAKICVTILDPQVHFSFEMFQGLVSLQTQARLEQLLVSKAATAATAAMEASVAAAAAAAEADATALTQQRATREEELYLSMGIAPGRAPQPQPNDVPPLQPEVAWANTERIPALLPHAGPKGSGVGFMGDVKPSIGVGIASSADAAAAPRGGGPPMALRVTNYSVSMGDLSMEGSLLAFLRNYVNTMRDGAGPGSQRRQRNLFGWVSSSRGGGGSRADEGPAEPALVSTMDFLRLHQQRRRGALGRALDELNAISATSQIAPDEGISVVTSSTSGESPPVPSQSLPRSLSWGFGGGLPQKQQQEELQMYVHEQQAIRQQHLQQPVLSVLRGSREPLASEAGNEEAVDSAELLLVASLMAAGNRSLKKANLYDRDLQRADGIFVQSQQQQQQMGENGNAISRRNGIHMADDELMNPTGEEVAPMTIALLQGVGEADFTDPFCRVIDIFLTLLSFKIPGETEFKIKGEVVKGAFEFHDAHGSLLKVSLLALEGQMYIHPEIWSADSVKKFGGRLEVMVSGYDPMTNSQEELLHPVAASVEIQRQYVDPDSSHWSLVNIRSAMDGVSVDITSGLLQLVYHIVRTTHEIMQGAEGNLGRHTSLRVYNDIHSDVLVMQRQRTGDKPRGWSYSRVQPDEWIFAPTASLYFAVRKHSAAAEVVPEKRHAWRRRTGGHEKLDEAQPTLRLDSYEEVKHVVEGLLKLGTNKVDSSWLRAYEETLLFASTRRAQVPLEMLVDDMPVLQAGGSAGMRHGWGGLLQLLRKEPGWCCLGRLHADYSNCRAYFLQNAGFKVLVEPVVDRRNGTWSLTVGSCVQLANACSMTLRVYVGRQKRNWGGRAISCFAARVTGENRGSGAPEEYIDILPGCRRSVPLSWFGSGTMPSLTALLYTEDGGAAGGEGTRFDSVPDVPPVAFPALYKLTNKTGYAQPRRLDISPFTLRLRGSLMLYGMVDTTDVPTSEASRIAQRYVLKLEPMLSIRNTLPFPITVSVSLRNTVDSDQQHMLGTGTKGSVGAAPAGGSVLSAQNGSAYATPIEAGRLTRNPLGNAQAGLLAELESRKRQKEEAQQRRSRGTAAKLVSSGYVEATIPSHQSRGFPVGEQRLWLVLRVHGAPLEQFNTQLEAFNPTDGRPLGPLELQLLASATSRGSTMLGGATWLLQQEKLDGVASQGTAGGEKTSLGTDGRGMKLQQQKQQRKQRQQPTTVYESQRFSVLLPTRDTLTVSKVLQLKDGRGESLLPPGTLKIARAEAMNQRRGKKTPPLFSEMQVAADVSRREITVFAPYFFENLTEATFSVNGALVPSRCRLYTTEEDMRTASIRAYKEDILADRVLQSSLSKKHDLSGISTARPPLILKLAAVRKQRGIRFVWGARVNSTNRDELPLIQEAQTSAAGSGESVVSSLNAGGGAERVPSMGYVSEAPGDTVHGDSPLLKPTPSSTDSFVDDDMGHVAHDTRLGFSTKRPPGAFGAKRNLSDAFSGGCEGEEEGFKLVVRAQSIRATVQRKLHKLGRKRKMLLRKKADRHGLDGSGADSGEKETLFGGDGGNQTVPTSAPSVVTVPEQSRDGNSSSLPPTLVLGICTRYGDAPYSTTKIVSVIPRYMVISRLPFSVMVREVRSRSRVLGGAMGGRAKVTPCELTLLPGETKAFHGREPRVLLAHTAKNLVSCSFTLVPPHVPSFFQVEMTPRGGGAKVYLPENCIIIQVSIVSGLFGDVPALPYTYNGSFIMLSLPEYPQFAILNLTSYFLAHSPAERSRRNQQSQLIDDAFAIPITNGSQVKSTNKRGRDDSDASLRLISPWGCVPFIPPYHKNLENTRVRLRVLDVDHCPWSVCSLASVDDELQTIDFIPHHNQQGTAPTGATTSPPLPPVSPRSVDGASARKAPVSQRVPIVSSAGTNLGTGGGATTSSSPNQQQQQRTCMGPGGLTSDGCLDTEGDPFSVQDGDLRLGRPHTPRGGGLSLGASGKEKLSATLYVFSLVAGSGSRILIVVEEREMAEKLRAGGSAFDMVKEELMGSADRDDGACGAAASAAAAQLYDQDALYKNPASIDSFPYGSGKQKGMAAPSGGGYTPDASRANQASLKKQKRRKASQLQKSQPRPPPWLGLSFEFRLPRLTVTWIHQSEVVLALHLTGLSLSGSVSPRQLDAFLEAVPLERVLCMTGIGVGGFSERNPVATGGLGVSAKSLPAVALPVASGSEDSQDSEGSPTCRSKTMGESCDVEEWGKDEQAGLPKCDLQKYQEDDYGMLVMTRSAVSVSVRIAMLHVDHFVKGDIPVILKNTTSKYGKDSEEFLEVAVVRSLVDPRQAPTYELLEVRISPFSANIELLVIEQLIRIYEKEVEMLHKFAVAAPQKPPALQTALNCSDAAEALRQLAVIDLLQRNRKEAALAAERTAGSTATTAPARSGGGSEGASAGPAAAAAAFLSHPFALDIAHPVSRTLPNSTERLRKLASTGPPLHSASGDLNVGEVRSVYSSQELLLRGPVSIQFYATPRVYINPPSSHVLVLPNPRWMELHRANPIYIKNLTISALSLTVSIRTSEHRISRQVLHIVDALPLDTPYMAIQIARERRKFTVCSWDELLHSLRNSYLRQFIRQSLPSAWISNPCAFIIGFLRGTVALIRQTVKGAKTSSNSFEGLMTGFRVGFILFIIYTMGGVMQSLSHVLNILHKLMRGSRPRPYGVLDAFWKGLNGLLLDTFWRPWVAVVTEPTASATRGDSWWKTTAILLACFLRCLISPLFGLSNFLASVAEGFANTLIGDFEQFTRVQERADLDKKHKQTSAGAVGGVEGAAGGLRQGSSRAGDPSGSIGYREPAAAGLGNRFRRGRRRAGDKPGGKPGVRSRTTESPVGIVVTSSSSPVGKQRGSTSFTNSFLRSPSKQVTFAV